MIIHVMLLAALIVSYYLTATGANNDRDTSQFMVTRQIVFKVCPSVRVYVCMHVSMCIYVCMYVILRMLT